MPTFFTVNSHASRQTTCLAIALATAVCLALSACSDASTPAADLQVQDAYIKHAVPGRKMTAAYATLTNHSADQLCFVGFEADFASRIELHVTEPVGGSDSQRFAMRRIDEQCLAPGERVTLEPGGKHLMVMGLYDNGLPPETVTATIRLGTRNGRSFEAEFAVVPFNYSPQNL